MWKPVSLFVLTVLIIAFFVLARSSPTSQSPVLGINEPSFASHQESSKKEIFFNGDRFSVRWEFVDTKNLSLIPNFSERETAKEVYLKNQCKLLVNGGFYSEDNMPIGMFVSGGREISGFSKNSLFNGFLIVNGLGTPMISGKKPIEPQIALQSGPILKENSAPHTLKLARDKPSRRVVAAVTGENKLLFLVFYKEHSTFSGPFLSDMPALISEFEEKFGVSLADAINLDGGSASSFYSKNFVLSEASPVGSFFCAR